MSKWLMLARKFHASTVARARRILSGDMECSASQLCPVCRFGGDIEGDIHDEIDRAQ